MSLGMTMAGEEIEITFCCPCLVLSVMDYVYRMWIQSAEKVQESSLMIIQLTSYDCGRDIRRRTSNTYVIVLPNRFHLNLITGEQSDKHTLKDILQSNCLDSLETSMSPKTKRLVNPLRLMETKETAQQKAMYHLCFDLKSGGKRL